MPAFDNILQDEVLDTTYLTSHIQQYVPTHFASYVTPDEYVDHADDALTHLTSYTPAATQYADLTPIHHTSYIISDDPDVCIVCMLCIVTC